MTLVIVEVTFTRQPPPSPANTHDPSYRLRDLNFFDRIEKLCPFQTIGTLILAVGVIIVLVVTNRPETPTSEVLLETAFRLRIDVPLTAHEAEQHGQED